MRRVAVVLAVAVLALGSPSFASARPQIGAGAPDRATARLIFVGDVMVGRNVAPAVAADPDAVFAGVAPILRSADLAAGNLESPLTNRPHLSPNPYALEAPPGSARVLATAGFDLMTIANNHSGDAGRGSVEDTWRALAGAGIAWAGAGPDLASAWEPLVLSVRGVEVAFVAVDGSRAGLPAGGSSPGIAHWDEERLRESIRRARLVADVVVASLHGGTEYLPTPDAAFARQVEVLLASGADVVWGHGPHVRQPVVAHGRRIAASSLGNFLFDQPYPGTTEGAILEVVAGRSGPVAFRVGDSAHAARRVVFTGWREVDGDAALIDGGWWRLLTRPTVAPAAAGAFGPAARRDPVLLADETERVWQRCGSGAVSLRPDGLVEGRTVHGRLPGAASILHGAGDIGCADVDGDGRTDPVRLATAGP